MKEQSDDTSDNNCTRKEDVRLEKKRKWMRNKGILIEWVQESKFGFGMDKRTSYVILFNSRQRIDLIPILLFMILIGFKIIEIFFI